MSCLHEGFSREVMLPSSNNIYSMYVSTVNCTPKQSNLIAPTTGIHDSSIEPLKNLIYMETNAHIAVSMKCNTIEFFSITLFYSILVGVQVSFATLRIYIQFFSFVDPSSLFKYSSPACNPFLIASIINSFSFK